MRKKQAEKILNNVYFRKLYELPATDLDFTVRIRGFLFIFPLKQILV